MSGSSALLIAMQIVDALHYTHDHGYTHADIKAENICFGTLQSHACNSCVMTSCRAEGQRESVSH